MIFVISKGIYFPSKVTIMLKYTWIALGCATLIASGGCRNTASGIVRDTENNTRAVGRGVKHVGEKIEDSTR